MTNTKVENYDDVTMYGLTPEKKEELLLKQNECTLIWTNKEGHGMGVTQSYIYRRGSVWLTATRNRLRIKALQRDPRGSVVISSAGTDIKVSQSITFKGIFKIHDDQATKDWFYPDFAAHANSPAPDVASFISLLDTPERVILELVPETSIIFDGGAMRDMTSAALSQS